MNKKEKIESIRDYFGMTKKEAKEMLADMGE